MKHPIRLLYSLFVIRSILPVVIMALLTLSCGSQPRAFAIPPQRSNADLGPDPDGVMAFVRMDEPQAPEYLVHDISPDPGFRRWAFVHPELRFRVNQTSGLTFSADFAVPEVTFKVTGPVTVSYSVNGEKLGAVRCDHWGDYEIRKPVPDGLIQPGKYIRVTFDANPRWVSPEDGAQLSFMLRSAGFIH